jgi:hypothetical protein
LTWVLSEVRFNDVLDLVDPRLFEVVRDLTGRRFLDLVEVRHFHWLGDVWIVNVLKKHVIAFLADLLHGPDGLVLIEHRVEAEVGESLWEIVGGNRDHTVVLRFLLFLFLRHLERSRNQIRTRLSHVLVKDYFIHRLGVFEVDFVE